jgi:hypothetical protein
MRSPRKLLYEVVRIPLRTKLAAWVVGHYIRRRIEFLGGAKKSDAISLLMFSAYRFRQDIEVMVQHPRLRIYEIDQRLLEIVNAFFVESNLTPNDQYFLESNSRILALREHKQRYIQTIARILARSGIDCAATPSIQYKIEHDWAAAFDAAGLPFVGLHKEFTVIDEEQLPMRIDAHRNRKQKFLGTWLCVTNDTGHQLFVEAGVFPAEKISTIGLLRMDRLFDPGNEFRKRQSDKRQAVLFSFGHLSGGFGGVRRRSHYFSADDDAGFVELFRAVHVGFAELALENPEAEFTIKLKNQADWWRKEIRAVVQEDLGVAFDEIPNLNMRDITAPELIRDAHAVIGFNSTVLLESQILNRSTIIPCFAEAAGPLARYVYLKSYFDLFAIATSKEDMKAKVRLCFDNPDCLVTPDRDRCRQMMTDYLGFDDGKTLERLVSVLENCVASRPKGIAT